MGLHHGEVARRAAPSRSHSFSHEFLSFLSGEELFCASRTLLAGVPDGPEQPLARTPYTVRVHSRTTPPIMRVQSGGRRSDAGVTSGPHAIRRPGTTGFPATRHAPADARAPRWRAGSGPDHCPAGPGRDRRGPVPQEPAQLPWQVLPQPWPRVLQELLLQEGLQVLRQQEVLQEVTRAPLPLSNCLVHRDCHQPVDQVRNEV